MRRQKNQPSTHDPRTVHDAVAEALDRDLPRTQARLIDAACNTVAAGGSHDELARLTGLSRRTLARTVASAGFPTPDRLLTWIRLLLAAKGLESGACSQGELAARAGYSCASAFRRAVRSMVNLTPGELKRRGAFAMVASAFRAEIATPADPELRGTGGVSVFGSGDAPGRPPIFSTARAGTGFVLGALEEAIGAQVSAGRARMVRAAVEVFASTRPREELSSRLGLTLRELRLELRRLRLPLALRLIGWIRLLATAKLFDQGTHLDDAMRSAGFVSRSALRSTLLGHTSLRVSDVRQGSFFRDLCSAFRGEWEDVGLSTRRPRRTRPPVWGSDSEVLRAAVINVIRRSPPRRRAEMRRYLEVATGFTTCLPHVRSSVRDERLARRGRIQRLYEEQGERGRALS